MIKILWFGATWLHAAGQFFSNALDRFSSLVLQRHSLLYPFLSTAPPVLVRPEAYRGNQPKFGAQIPFALTTVTSPKAQR